MRTTVTLDDDVAAAVEQLRREQHLGLSEAVNQLARAGLRHRPRAQRRARFVASSLGLRVDVSNVAEVLDELDDEEDRSPARR
jgi:Ribbon-helix-helix protein, copG family